MSEDQKMEKLKSAFAKAVAERGFDAGHSAGHVVIAGLSSSRERTAVVHENSLSEEELAVLGKFVPLSEYQKSLDSLDAQNMIQQKDLFLKNLRGLIQNYRDRASVEQMSGSQALGPGVVSSPAPT